MCKKGLTWESIFFIITFNKIQIPRELVLDIYNLHIHLLDQAIGWHQNEEALGLFFTF